MDKNQNSQGANASVLSTANRHLFWTRLFVLALFLALSLASLQPRSSAKPVDQTFRWNKASITSQQPRSLAQAADELLRVNMVSMTSRQPRASARNWTCPQQCEQAYVECLQQGGTNCGAEYDACFARCH